MLDVNSCPEGLVAAALKGPLWSYAYVSKFLRRCYIRVLTDIPHADVSVYVESGTLRIG